MDFSGYEIVCRSGSDVPDELRAHLAPFVVERLGRPVRELFQELSRALPRVMNALEEHYAAPVLCGKRGVRQLMPRFVFEGIDRNVFGIPHLPDFYTLGYFEQSVGALPVMMRSLYFVTDALQMTRMNYPEIQWTDLPAPISGRRDIADYCELRGYDESAALPMIKTLGTKAIYVWVIGSRGDALCVDSTSDSGRLYHVHGDDFADFHTIPDPDSFIDRYCAYVLAGHDIGDFDFRQ